MIEDMFFKPRGAVEDQDEDQIKRDVEDKKEFSSEDEENFKKELIKRGDLYDDFLMSLEEKEMEEMEEKRQRAKEEKENKEKEIAAGNEEKKYIPPIFDLTAFEFEELLRAQPSEEKFEKHFQKLIDEKLKNKKLDYGEELKLFDYLKEKFKGSEKIIDKMSAKYGVKITSEEERLKLQAQIPADVLHTNDQLREFNMNYSDDIINPNNELETRNVIVKILNTGIDKYKLPIDQKTFLKESRKINSTEKTYFNKFVNKILEEKINELKNI